eukprot:725119_1
MTTRAQQRLLCDQLVDLNVVSMALPAGVHPGYIGFRRIEVASRHRHFLWQPTDPESTLTCLGALCDDTVEFQVALRTLIHLNLTLNMSAGTPETYDGKLTLTIIDEKNRQVKVDVDSDELNQDIVNIPFEVKSGTFGTTKAIHFETSKAGHGIVAIKTATIQGKNSKGCKCFPD